MQDPRQPKKPDGGKGGGWNWKKKVKITLGDVSRYRRGRTIAKTLFGRVRYGFEVAGNKWVILKESRRDLALRTPPVNTSGHPVKEDLMNEILIQQTLQSGPQGVCPHLGRLLDTCQDNVHIYQVLEYYNGAELFDDVSNWGHAAVPSNTPQPTAVMSLVQLRDSLVNARRTQLQNEASQRGGAEAGEPEQKMQEAPPKPVEVNPADISRSDMFNAMANWVNVNGTTISCTEVRARCIFREVVEGTFFMHSMGICHRDMSLENTLLDANGNAKIIDFGLARQWNPDQPNPFQCTHANGDGGVGKTQYMSPECYVCGHTKTATYDARANDIWCMGVMLFMMLFGVPPYQNPTRADGAFKYITSGRIMTLLRHWNRAHLATPDAIDLLNRIFLPEAQRITLEDLRRHPFLRNLGL